MSTEEKMAVKDAVYVVQLALLDGIKDQRLLFAARTLMSHGDYEDVVTERTIANLCGYPLCTNSLPTDQLRRGRYRISLKEHKVYDLEEMSRFCSSGCLISSRVYSKSLQEERCSVLNPMKLKEILSMFKSSGSDSLGEKGDAGISKLTIVEKKDAKSGELSLGGWIGPSDAIEGYVPRKALKSKSGSSKIQREGFKANYTNKANGEKDFLISETDFMSTIITSNEYSVSKLPPLAIEAKFNESSEFYKGEEAFNSVKQQAVSFGSRSSVETDNLEKKAEPLKGKIKVVEKDHDINETASHSFQSASSMDMGNENIAAAGTALRPSLKAKGTKKLGRSVTWADEISHTSKCGNLCEVRAMQDSESAVVLQSDVARYDGGDKLRFKSAEACARALCEAAEAIASGESKTCEAAGITILPYEHHIDEHVSEREKASETWHKRPIGENSDLFDPEQSWFDAPPEGFCLKLSPFAMMWNALFGWVTSSSLAYIYGRDESCQDQYLFVGGREYPRKIVLGDGRSSEIRETLGGYLERALPGLVTDLALPVSLSDLEKKVACLLDTMSFVEAVPAFRVKQWQVLSLVLVDALSLYQLPALTPYLTNARVLLHKVLDGARIGVKEYEVIRDHLTPLGRLPQLSMQSGG